MDLLDIIIARQGMASLDGNGKVPSSQLPSYVDDVREFSAKSDFPTPGESGIIYLAKDTNMTWRWDDEASTYINVSSGIELGTEHDNAARGDHLHDDRYVNKLPNGSNELITEDNKINKTYLPETHKLVLTGAIEAEYDGTKDVSVEITTLKGDKGDKGDTGAAGEDGFSPLVTMTPIDNGYHITIEDTKGLHEADLYNGIQGPQGETGPQGPQGI